MKKLFLIALMLPVFTINSCGFEKSSDEIQSKDSSTTKHKKVLAVKSNEGENVENP